MELLSDLLFDYTLRTVALGAAVLGAIAGALGSFAVLRRQALIGDAMSHAALPGIALAYLLTGSKSSLVLVLGAAVAGWVGTLVVMAVVHRSRIPSDSALGIVLSVFFGFGLVLLTFLQRRPDARQAGLDTFLFGQAATLLGRDVVVIALLSSVALGLLLLFWKEFKMLAFDPEFGAALGYRMRAVDVLLTTTLVLAIVVGLQTVGVVLMSALVVAPAVAARQWTDGLGPMVALAGLFGALSGVVGAVVSASGPDLPTGPLIVLVATGIVALSLLAAPARGLVWAALHRRRQRRRVRADAVLLALDELARGHHDPEHAHPVPVLRAALPRDIGVERSLAALEARGLARHDPSRGWSITAEGRRHAAATLGGGSTGEREL
ncbi:MAG: metal ABC transporter permease [Gemmatimonadota bacterium]|nr:metal ABC transporter permease [Gemmatimonadota bacterium]